MQLYFFIVIRGNGCGRSLQEFHFETKNGQSIGLLMEFNNGKNVLILF